MPQVTKAAIPATNPEVSLGARPSFIARFYFTESCGGQQRRNMSWFGPPPASAPHTRRAAGNAFRTSNEVRTRQAIWASAHRLLLRPVWPHLFREISMLLSGTLRGYRRYHGQGCLFGCVAESGENPREGRVNQILDWSNLCVLLKRPREPSPRTDCSITGCDRGAGKYALGVGRRNR